LYEERTSERRVNGRDERRRGRSTHACSFHVTCHGQRRVTVFDEPVTSSHSELTASGGFPAAAASATPSAIRALSAAAGVVRHLVARPPTARTEQTEAAFFEGTAVGHQVASSSSPSVG